jgi:DNA-nicking Smr family endonuclease
VQLFAPLIGEPEWAASENAMAMKHKIADSDSLTQLSAIVKEAGLRLRASECEATQEKADKTSEPPPPSGMTDEEIFSLAMTEVHRAHWPPTSPTTLSDCRPRSDNQDNEDRKLMQAAMDESVPLPVLNHPEYIEGWIGVTGRRFLPNLRNGTYSIQGQIDLHGLARDEARQAVEDFVSRMSRYRSCCVKIIHGRGINSPNDRAVLKENLQRWLCSRRMSHQVVAYASAPVTDGGVGAVYVLLQSQ